MFSYAVRAASFVVALTMAAAAPAGAQVVETPVPFDSAGKVRMVTPGLAQRLQLAPAGWPVTGEFERVRLYRTSAGEYVIVAESREGALHRWPLSATEGDALRSRVSAALRESTHGVGTQTTVASEPAGNSFVRRQASLGAILYGPAAAAMLAGEGDDDGTTAGAAYLFVAGGTFFAAMARRQASPPVTTAQNNLSTWGAIHGAALGGAAAYMTDAEGQGAAGMILAGSVGGTVLGLAAAKDMTDAESASSSFAATSAALTTLGVAGTAGMFDEDGGSSRAAIGLSSAALVGGHVLGPRYPRRAGYVVTAGDVRTLWVPGVIGAMAGLVPFVESDSGNGKVVAAAMTAGFVGGVIVGDRFLVKPYDHSTSDAVLLATGATAGWLVAGGLTTLADAGPTAALGAGVTGATLGAIWTESLLRKSPRRQEQDAMGGWRERERRVGVTVDPAGLIFAAARAPGRFSLVRMTF